MGDQWKKVQPGDRLKIPAATFNTMIDAATAHRARAHDVRQLPQPSVPHNTILLVQNSSGADRDRFEVLAIDSPIFTPTEAADTFQNDVLLVGVEPSRDHAPAEFVVLAEPVPADELGRAYIAGDCGYPSTVQLDDGTIVTIYYRLGSDELPPEELERCSQYELDTFERPPASQDMRRFGEGIVLRYREVDLLRQFIEGIPLAPEVYSWRQQYFFHRKTMRSALWVAEAFWLALWRWSSSMLHGRARRRIRGPRSRPSSSTRPASGGCTTSSSRRWCSGTRA